MKYVIVVKDNYVGNCLLFWKQKGAGYTCDLSSAEVFDEKESADIINNSPEKYNRYDVNEMVKIAKLHVDMQNIKR